MNNNYSIWEDFLQGAVKTIKTEDDLTIAKTLRRLGRDLTRHFSEDYIEQLEVDIKIAEERKGFSEGEFDRLFKKATCKEDINNIVDTLIACTSTGGCNNDPFWKKSEKALLNAVMVYIYSQCSEEEKTLASVCEFMRYEAKYLDAIFEGFEADNFCHYAIDKYNEFKSNAGQTAKSVINSCNVRLAQIKSI